MKRLRDTEAVDRVAEHRIASRLRARRLRDEAMRAAIESQGLILSEGGADGPSGCDIDRHAGELDAENSLIDEWRDQNSKAQECIDRSADDELDWSALEPEPRCLAQHRVGPAGSRPDSSQVEEGRSFGCEPVTCRERSLTTATDIREQIKRRRERALEEIQKIVNRGSHPLFSQFEVTSASGQTYRVEVRSLEELENSCTCPDYKTNLIGTCKHIEGVLIHLRKEHAENLEQLLKKRPRGTQIYLHYGSDITVRVLLPLPSSAAVKELLERYFDPSGVLAGSPTQSLLALFSAMESLPARQKTLITIAEAVREYLALLEDRDEVGEQKEWFLDQVNRGRRTFDLLSTKLYPYQEQGALHLAFGRRAMLADDMGLGKTVQGIAAAALLKEMRDIRRAVIVCPASLKHQWEREIRRFTSLSVSVVEGNIAARRRLYRDATFFKIINYELVRHDTDELVELRPDLLILDEAQRIKNWRAKTAQKVKALSSRYAFVLTGTPLENRIDELYSIFQFLDPRILGPLWHFNDRFYDLEKRSSGTYRVLGYKNLDQLRTIIAPYLLRRTRDEVLSDLPPRIDNNFFVEMTDGQWKAYNEYRETLARLVSKSHRAPLSPKERELLLMCLVKMRLVCDALALHDKKLPPKDHVRTSPKLGELGEILSEEISTDGHKAVVFSQWANMLTLAEPVIRRAGLGYVKLTGAVPSAKRGKLIQRFFDDPDCRVFLSTDAGGVGLNLQAADFVINLDLPWNPAVLEQRIARAHRHGQPSSVRVINLVAKGTIEERMLDTLAAKREVFASVFGTDESPSAVRFEDTGQSLLQKLGELLENPTEVELDLAPVAPGEEPVAAAGTGESGKATHREAPSHPPTPSSKPTLKGFAALLLDRLPGKILLVRQAPSAAHAGLSGRDVPSAAADSNRGATHGAGEATLTGASQAGGSQTGQRSVPAADVEAILVVVAGAPGDLRPTVEEALTDHYDGNPPVLHLMDSEGYKTLSAFVPALTEIPAPETVAYHSVGLPTPSESDTDRIEVRRRRARFGLEFAEKRRALAQLLLGGGFPEEMTRPLREALGWGLSSLLALHGDREPSVDLPSARLVQAELVERGHLPAELSLRLSQVRDLTEPAPPDVEVASLSSATGKRLLESVGDLVTLAQEQTVKAGI